LRLVRALGDPLDLHSFPTRRSSDLRSVACRVGGVHRERVATGGQSGVAPRTRARGSRARVQLATEGRAGLARAEGEGRRRLIGEDRKSTRLNSSHRTISYAVFCLKK